MVKMSQAQLEDEQRKLADNQKIDKLYNDYFARWVDKEGKIDEAKLKQKLQKMAEDLGLNVVEMVPLSTQESGKLGANGGRTNSGGPAVVPGMPPYIGAGAMSASKSFIEMKITLLGSFQQLMVWMEKAENELGSMRFVQSRWMNYVINVLKKPSNLKTVHFYQRKNRSSSEKSSRVDEVRLTVGFRYRMIEDLK